MQTNKAVRMAPGRIVMRPMDERKAAGIVHHLAANLDAVAHRNRAARCDIHVVDDFQRSGVGNDVEGFVPAVRARAVKEMRR